MNVSFRTIRRSGDKAYVLSEISGYDERFPVVLTASTESGARIPSDTFPYCDITDALALQEVLFDGALACHETPLSLPHAKNSAGVRFFVVVLPWLAVKRWKLEFRAIDSHGEVIASCRKSLDVFATGWKALANERTSPATGALIEDLDGRFIHDRIHVRFARLAEVSEDELLISAMVEMPYHEESTIEFDFLDKHGRPLSLDPIVVEDSVAQSVDYGALQRRVMIVSVRVKRSNPYVCLCATDTAALIAPGFAMLGAHTIEALTELRREHTTSAFDDPEYHTWFTQSHRADVPVLLEQVSTRFDYAPLFSIVCVLTDTPTHHVFDMLNSVMQQSYGRWELILVDVAGQHRDATELKDVFDLDRVYVIDADPSMGPDESFDAGMSAAEGDFVVFMKVCDMLAPDALFECVRKLNEFSDCDVLYSDVDTLDAQGMHTHPVFRPAFSPELLRSYNYLRDFIVVRSSLLTDMHHVPHLLLGAASYDLALRVTERARRVCHVPRVLCHRRLATEGNDSFLVSQIEQEAGRRALVEHCQRIGLTAEVLSTDEPGHYRVRHVLKTTPHVTIVLPSRNNPELLLTSIRSLYSKIQYKNFEVLVVDAEGFDEETRTCFEQLEKRYPTLSVLHWEEDFNRARIINCVAAQTEGEYLMFLSEDTRILTDDSLEVMLGYFQSPEVGVVGPKQLFADGTIEHAGIVVGGTQAVTPLFRYMPGDWHGYLDRAAVAQNVSAVASECMMVRRSAFEAVGGFNEGFSTFFPDVEFCLRAREAGFLTVFTPHVCLSHFHGVSRVRVYSTELRMQMRREAALLASAWPRYFVEGDAFYNPNLDHDSSYFALKHTEH